MLTLCLISSERLAEGVAPDADTRMTYIGPAILMSGKGMRRLGQLRIPCNGGSQLRSREVVAIDGLAF